MQPARVLNSMRMVIREDAQADMHESNPVSMRLWMMALCPGMPCRCGWRSRWA